MSVSFSEQKQLLLENDEIDTAHTTSDRQILQPQQQQRQSSPTTRNNTATARNTSTTGSNRRRARKKSSGTFRNKAGEPLQIDFVLASKNLEGDNLLLGSFRNHDGFRNYNFDAYAYA